MLGWSLALSNEAGIYGLVVGESWLWWGQLLFLQNCSRSDETCAIQDHQLIVSERSFVLTSSRGALRSGWQGENGMIYVHWSEKCSVLSKRVEMGARPIMERPGSPFASEPDDPAKRVFRRARERNTIRE